MKFNIPSPSDYAKAVFDKPIVGPPISPTITIGNPDEDMDDIKIGDSHKYCLNQVMDKLKLYHFHPTLLTNKTPLTKLRSNNNNFMEGHKSYSSTRPNYIYCKDCFNMKVDNIEEVTCCVIATTTYKEMSDVVDGVKTNVRASVEVTALFPHCSQCTLEHQSMRNYKMDTENEGRGWDVFLFPVEEILRDTYANICNVLKNTGEDNPQPGMLMYINPQFYACNSHTS